MDADPLSGSPWSQPATVEGFARSAPNANLIDYVRLVSRGRPLRIADIGCGAARNAVAMAERGSRVIATDLSWPMCVAAHTRLREHHALVALAPMEALPIRDRSIDLVVAHGIWNLARSDRNWQRAVGEAARISAPGGRLFVFTFSRHTLSEGASAVEGEQYVFTEFSGSPQVFMTGAQLVGALRRSGFAPDPDLPLRELNVTPPGQLRTSGAPVIYEGGFVFEGA